MDNERKMGSRAASIGLMIGVSSPMSLAMLCAPELLARAREACLNALRTRWRDGHFRLRFRRRRDDEYRAAGVPYRRFCDGAQ